METSCIYCQSEGPFTDEHVFPAGLGGDDGRYMLKGLVCQACNTGVFSKLELAVARRGPEAFARLFLQPEGRGTGKRASTPSLQTEVTSFTDPETGLVLEAELLNEGRPVLLPQVLFFGQTLSVSGSSAEEITALFEQLKILLDDELCVIKKDGQGAGAAYEVECYRWQGEGYEVLEPGEVYAQPPKHGIWREDLRVPDHAGVGERCVARLFRRRQGQLVLRVLPNISIQEHLSVLRHEHERLAVAALPPPVSVPKPSMHVRLGLAVDALARVLAKIGLNFVCHEYGESYARLAPFDPVKKAVLTGDGPVQYSLVASEDLTQGLLSRPGENLHVIMLATVPGDVGQRQCAIFIRLYGGPLHLVKLAEGELPERLPVFFTVDYERHVIQRYDLQDWPHSR